MHPPIDSFQLRPYERKFTNPRVDILFKRVFGSEKNKGVLKSFLREMTGQEIVSLDFQNSELPGLGELDDKTVRLDVLATVRTSTGTQIVNIEVQNLSEAGLVNRSLYYWARLYSGQLKKGMSYEDVHPTVVIFILNEPLFAAEPRHVSRYHLKEALTGQELQLGGRPLELMFIELSKVRKRLDIDPKALSRLEQWLVFLAADSDEILEELRMEAHEPELDQALSEIEYAALSKRDQLLYQARMDAIRDQESLLIDRERRGKAEGKVEGNAEMLLKIAKARFGALSDTLEESILSLPLEQLDEVGLLVATCLDAEAFKSALGALKTHR